MQDSVTPVEIAKSQPGFVKTPLVDNIVDRSLAYVGAGFPIHLTGPAGTGKTCLALYIAGQIGRPVIIMHGDEELATTDVVGGQYGTRQKRVRDNFIQSVKKLDHTIESMWVDNRLTVACKYGYTLVYDEFTRSRAEANNAFLSVLEERTLDMPAGRGDESFVKVHENFRAIFTSNPSEYAGVHKAADALQDRMITLKLGHYDRDTEIAITAAKSGIGEKAAAKIVDIVRSFRRGRETETGGENCPTIRASIMIATVLKTYGAKPTLSDKSFVWLCQDVLDSSRWNSRPSRTVKTQVNSLLKKYAA